MELKNLRISFKKADNFRMKTGINEIELDNVDDGNIELSFEAGKIKLREDITNRQTQEIETSNQKEQIFNNDKNVHTSEITKETGYNNNSKPGKLTTDTLEEDEKQQSDDDKTFNDNQNNLMDGALLLIEINENIDINTIQQFSKHLENIFKQYESDIIKLVFPEGERDNIRLSAFAFFKGDFLSSNTVNCIRSAIQLFKDIHAMEVPAVNSESLKIVVNTGLMKDYNIDNNLSLHSGTHERIAYEMLGITNYGNITVSEKIYNKLIGLFNFAESGSIEVDGHNGEISIYRFVSEKPEPMYIYSQYIGDVYIPLLFKDKLFDTIKSVMEKSITKKITQVYTLTGHANTGKTRISNELLRYISENNIDAAIYHNRSSWPERSYLPMDVFREMIVQKALLHYKDKSGDNNSLIESYLTEVLKGKIENSEESVNLVLTLLGFDKSDNTDGVKIDSDSDTFRIKAFYILKKVIEHISGNPNQAIIMIIDDMQWLDDLSVKFIVYLSESIQNRPLFILCLARPEFLNDYSSWSKHKDHYINAETVSMSDSESVEFVRYLLKKVDDIPADLVHKIVNIAKGDASFIIEILQLLINLKLILINELEGIWYPDIKGIKDYQLPTSLDYTILIQYDNLSEKERQLLSLSAIIGYEFKYDMLDTMFKYDIKPVLNMIVEKKLIESIYIDNQGYLYRYASHSVHNSILRSIEKKKRVNYNLLLFNHIDDTKSNNPYSSLYFNKIQKAFYLLNVGENKRSADLFLCCVEYFTKTGADITALKLYEKINSSVDLRKYHDTAVKTYLNKGLIYFKYEKYHEAVKNFDALINISERTKNYVLESKAMNLIAKTYIRMNYLDRAYDYSRSALSLSEKTGDTIQKAISNKILGMIYNRRGLSDRAEEHLKRAVMLIDDGENKSELAELFKMRAKISLDRNDGDRAMKLYSQAFSLYKELGLKSDMCEIFLSFAHIYKNRNITEKALENYKKALRLAESIGDRKKTAEAYIQTASLLRDSGNESEALNYYLEAVGINTELENKTALSEVYYNIALIYKNQEKLRKSIENFDKALDIYNELDNKIGMANSLKNIADVYKNKENYRSALRCYEKSAELMELVSYKDGIIDAYKSLGDIYRTIGDNVKAIEYRAKISKMKNNEN